MNEKKSLSQSYIQYDILIKPFFIMNNKNKKDNITTKKIDK